VIGTLRSLLSTFDIHPRDRTKKCYNIPIPTQQHSQRRLPSNITLEPQAKQ
jgi:hypothetical protein